MSEKREVGKWIIMHSEALGRNVALNKETGSVTTEEIESDDILKYEPRVTYTNEEIEILNKKADIGEIDMNVHMFKWIFRGEIVDPEEKRD